MHARRTLLDLFDAALREPGGRRVVGRQLRNLLDDRQRISVFAIGKAASSMALGALDQLAGRIAELLVITKTGHSDPELAKLPFARIIESAHPIPDARSLAAGEVLHRRLTELGNDTYPLFLISGGSSSLVEMLVDGATLADLRALNERGLASGWDITRLNSERSRLSRLKGGGVARLLAGRRASALFISDVPDDDTGVIGSGLLGRCSDVADSVERTVIANLWSAMHGAAFAADACGLDLECRADRFDGDASRVAAQFVAAMRDTRADGLIWVGESTVKLPEETGRGGRNTHLALTAARLLRPGEALTILAAGTDGTDGATEDAGAIVDAGTVERAEIAGCDVERAFRDFDSGTALEASGDLVHTGPTGTNVGDILIGLKRSATSVRDAARGHML
jgi:glycerate 2-kinase